MVDSKIIKEKLIKIKNKIVAQSKEFLTDLPNKFYNLGKNTSINAIKIANKTKEILIKALNVAFTATKKGALCALKGIDRALNVVFDIVSYPFRKIYAAVKVIGMGLYHSRDMHVGKKVTTVTHFVGAGMKNNKKFFTTVINYSLPVMGIIVFVATFNFTNTQTYAVNVMYNDEVIGYVENENTVEKAKKIVQNMMVFTDDTEEIAIKPEYEITVLEGEKMLSEYQLAEAIISESGGEMIDAEGLYVDGTSRGRRDFFFKEY